jgi:hypothetical protein
MVIYGELFGNFSKIIFVNFIKIGSNTLDKTSFSENIFKRKEKYEKV